MKIDRNKCKFSQGCRRCMEICPASVFLSYAEERRTEYSIPKKYYVAPILDHLCIECFKCVEECKEEAISIKR